MAIIFIRSVIIYILVIVAVRLMGKRQVGELKPHELVITILLSAVAVVPLEDNSMPLANCAIPILLFISLEIIVAVISMKSYKLRDLIQGKPIFIIRRGKLNQRLLKDMRFTVDDLVDALRQAGSFSLDEIEDAVIETNGKISVLLKSQYKPLCANDISLKTDEHGMPITVIMDGKAVEEYFNKEKISKSQIKLLLTSEGKDESDIMLMTVDDSGKTFVIDKEKV